MSSVFNQTLGVTMLCKPTMPIRLPANKKLTIHSTDGDVTATTVLMMTIWTS